MKKISVITPSYNSGNYIERAIQSVLDQSYEKFEHIIVDGDSSDNTLNILKRYSHLQWISEKDKGQSEAMNKGFDLSTGDIIVYLNADDYFYPQTFKTVVQAFKDSNIDIVFGNLEMRTQKHGTMIKKPSTVYEDILEIWKADFPVNPIQYFYKRQLQEKTAFNEDNHLAMDHEFLLSICKNSTIKYIDETFGVFDMVEGSKTAEGTKDPQTYWTTQNFIYIDKFLQAYSKKYILQFKNQQLEFFMKNMGVYKFLLTKVQNKLQNYKRAQSPSIKQIEGLLSSLPKTTELIIYGAGKQAENIFFALHSYIKYYIDIDAKIKKDLGGIPIFSPKKLEIENKPTILVTPIGYKKEITQLVAHHNKDAQLIFLEDYLHD